MRLRMILATMILFAVHSAKAEEFDVVIAGGTTASFAAAVASAEEGARTCLIEPTDWIGGQLTASGVPAVDEAWHRITDPKTNAILLDVRSIARRRENMTPNFRAMLDATGNPGRGWVSNYCFEPQFFLDTQLLPLERKLKNKLVVYRNTVVKNVAVDTLSRRITSITAIRRTPREGVEQGGYDRLPSEDIPDWYNPEASSRFTKEVFVFPATKTTIFMDATEWGELLALSGANYLQGIESVDGKQGDDRCGQSTVYGFVERYHAKPIDEPAVGKITDDLGFGDYTGRPQVWDLIWTYRRLKGNGKGPTPGDLSLQNWGYSTRLKQGGNDYTYGYLFKSKKDTEAQRADWRGGVDLKVMAAVEQRAFSWHSWFKAHAPEGIDPRQITLATDVFGTKHGLAKLPYIRDTRRAVGLDGFVLKIDDLTGWPKRKTGEPFPDRVALGAYPADIHPMTTCEFPEPALRGAYTLPFFIPFRALTSESFDNLLVAGKTMSQSFMANAATRLHPIEWSTGTAAGVAAADMARNGRTSREEFAHIAALQTLVRKKTPLEWTIDGETIPHR